MRARRAHEPIGGGQNRPRLTWVTGFSTPYQRGTGRGGGGKRGMSGNRKNVRGGSAAKKGGTLQKVPGGSLIWGGKDEGETEYQFFGG